MDERDPATPATDEQAQRAFEILSDELRLRILQALSARLREAPEDPTLGFADLRRAVGRPDSGNFNYHLTQLEGRFVRKTDAGYRLTAAGLRVVAAVFVGGYGGGETFGPAPLDEDCPVCADPLTARYADGLFTVDCPNDHEFRHPLPHGVIDDRDLEGMIEVLTLRIQQSLETAVKGTCPFCYAQLGWDPDPPFDPDFPHFSTVCSRCGGRMDVPVVAPLFTAPQAMAFYRDREISLRENPPWAPAFYRHVRAGVVDSDPLRIQVVTEVAGDRLEATLDTDLSVLEVTT